MMRSIRRALKSIVFYWKRNVMLASAFLVITIILLGMGSIRKTMNRAIAEIGKSIHTELSVRVKDATALSYETSYYFQKNAMEELLKINGVQKIDTIALANACGVGVEEVLSESEQSIKQLSEEEGLEYYSSEAEKTAGEITVVGVDDLSKAWAFEKREAHITAGTGISKQNMEAAVAVVSERFLDWNLLKIGDEISLVNAQNEAYTMQVTIIGTHSDNYESTSVADSAMNYIYVPVKQCVAFNGGYVVQGNITIDRPQDTMKLAADIQNILEKQTGKKLVIHKDQMTYLSAIAPLRGIQKVCDVMFYVTYAILLLILLLLIGRMMIKQEKEMMIWAVIGEGEAVVLIQLIFEILFPVLTGMVLGSVCAVVLEERMGYMLGILLKSFSNLSFSIQKTVMVRVIGVTIFSGIVMITGLFVKHQKKSLLRGVKWKK